MSGPTTLSYDALADALVGPDAPDLAVEGRPMRAVLEVALGQVSLRLRRMAGRWLVTATGPRGEVEVGADRSPYLAAQLALERWQPDQVQVMVAVGAMRPADVVEAESALIGG
jgi:hypothetical protein